MSASRLPPCRERYRRFPAHVATTLLIADRAECKSRDPIRAGAAAWRRGGRGGRARRPQRRGGSLTGHHKGYPVTQSVADAGGRPGEGSTSMTL